MKTDAQKMVEALEKEGWEIGRDGRITRKREDGSVQVNATTPLARVTLDKPLQVNVRVLVAAKHLGEQPAGTRLVSIDGNPANTAVENLRYQVRPNGNRAEVQANRAKRAQERAEKLAEAAKAAAKKAREEKKKADALVTA